METDLIDAVDRYLLDIRDAAILLDLQGAGVTAVVTEDPDPRRAEIDFDVYTWL